MNEELWKRYKEALERALEINEPFIHKVLVEMADEIDELAGIILEEGEHE